MTLLPVRMSQPITLTMMKVRYDNVERPDQTEEMNYRETVRAIRSFMGWTHIPDFESDLNEPDKSNNPWKGKNPKRQLVSLWIYLRTTGFAKIWRLNTVVAEGYPFIVLIYLT